MWLLLAKRFNELMNRLICEVYRQTMGFLSFANPSSPISATRKIWNWTTGLNFVSSPSSVSWSSVIFIFVDILLTEFPVFPALTISFGIRQHCRAHCPRKLSPKAKPTVNFYYRLLSRLLPKSLRLHSILSKVNVTVNFAKLQSEKLLWS